ncbi:MAG TPA: nucleoside hydrolase [Levilinea sp.]|nr:nucleoside hydrolase [Levilinea sp.]
MTESTAWFIDTDAGVDDAVALLVCLQQDGFDCKAITTVAGNTSLENVNANVGRVLDLLKKDIPFYSGAGRPLFQNVVRAEDIMAADGLGGASASLPPVRHFPESEHAALRLPALIHQASKGSKIGLITLGPLTNLALAVRLFPEMAAQVDRLVVMGGAVYGQGNASPVAEFNFFCDAEAAAVVFNAGFKEIWLLPWEVSVQQPLSWAQFDRLCALDSDFGRFFQMTMQSSVQFLHKIGFSGLPLPDLLAAVIAMQPALARELRAVHVEIEYSQGPGYGLCAVDWHHLTGRAPNARVVTAVDADEIYALLEQKLSG